MKEFVEKLIGRLEELEKAPKVESQYNNGWVTVCQVMKGIVNQLAEEYNNGWIPFTQRELDEEEKEYYGDEIKYMLDCKLPEEDEEILVTYKWKDEFYVGNDTFLRYGSACYLDSSREFITEAIAWKPLPEPFKPSAE